MTAQITTLPLSALTLAEENARFGVTYDEDALRDLANSIRSPLGLLDPLKAYATDAGAAVWDGGRRLAALGLIAADDAGAALLASVPVILTSREEARLASMATFVRADMHPAERFLTYNRLFEDGQTAQQIAAACAVSERGVAQLLRFRMLAPEIFAAFRDGGIDLDAAFAFTLTDNHDHQREVLASFGEKIVRAMDVRGRIKKGSVSATDRRARYVGRDAYAEAGGTFFADLFTQREIDETWADEALLQRLFDEKLADQVEALRTEGWSQVKVINDSYGWAGGYARLDKDAETKGKKPQPTWSAEAMATGTAFIVIDYNGVKLERGWTKETPNGGDKPKQKSIAQQNPALYGYGNKGHAAMTYVATVATRVGLVRKPEAAYDAMLTHLAWVALRKPQYGGVAESSASTLVPERRFSANPGVEVQGGDEFFEAVTSWDQRLPKARVAFNDAVAKLSADEKAQLLAVCFAATLDAVEAKVDSYTMKPERWLHLGWMARHAGVKMTEAWTPDADFLKGAGRDVLLTAAKEIAPRDADSWANAKKGDVVAFVAAKVEAKPWVPQLLRDFTSPADPKKAKE